MSASLLCDRILERAGLAGLTLSPIEVDQLGQYYELLQRWNRTINLSSMVFEDFPDVTLDKIIVEPIVIKGLISELGVDWLDVGSGCGSPAIPLKIVCSDKQLLMVESRSRKAAFLREVIRRLTLERSSVWSGRVEELTVAGIGEVGVVTMRAVKPSERVLTAVAALLRPGGRLAIFGSGGPPGLGSLPFRFIDSTKLPVITRTEGAVGPAENAVHWFVRA